MHKHSLHNKPYDFSKLIHILPELEAFVFINKHQTTTIDFSDPKAVKLLNTALLYLHYNIKYWHFPDTNLCPPIPSRIDYLHYLADLIGDKPNINILDIGTGASCIYPVLGVKVYNWQFVGTDIDQDSLKNAQTIIDKNNLNNNIELRFQDDKNNILTGIIKSTDKFTATICNPPFYKSFDEALDANKQKQTNLGLENNTRNFSGGSNELCYKGGEKAFLHNYLYQSSLLKDNCIWFTSLVSKKENVKSMYASLNKLNVTEIKTIEMKLGNKITRIVAWRFI